MLLSERLTARDALGITSWKGWDDLATPPARLVSVEPSVDPGLDELRARARGLSARPASEHVRPVAVRAGSRYTVIGETDPLAMVCALGDLLGETPAFASDESEDSRQDLPTAVFLREAPVSATTVARWRLDPAAPIDDPLDRQLR